MNYLQNNIMQDELQRLKKNDFSVKNFQKKNEDLTPFQLVIIFIILLIMLVFIIYKIGYIILINKASNSEIRGKAFNYEEKENNKQNKDNKINIEDFMISISYAENLEDLILNSFFYNENKGFYIDIGEFGPERTSTTKYFYLKGWNGMNIKPLNYQYKELIKSRPNDININYYMENNILKKFVFNGLNNINNTFIKLSDVFNEFIPKNMKIHFCKINMKENVRQILLGIDFKKYSPVIFSIKSNTVGYYNYESYEYILIKNDYIFIYQYEDVRYYLKNNYGYLNQIIPSLDEIIKVFKDKINKSELI